MSAGHSALAPPPADPLDLFLAFNRLALQGFGGVIAVAQHEIVEHRRWLDRGAFLELLTAAQLLPGPNIVNLSLMLGDRFHGLRGALAAAGGLLCVPMAIVLLLATAYTQFADSPTVAAMLRGMGAVAAGLVVATALRLVGALAKNPFGRAAGYAAVALTVLAVAVMRWPLLWVLTGLGSLSVGYAWWRLRP